MSDLPPHAITVTCPACGHTIKMHRDSCMHGIEDASGRVHCRCQLDSNAVAVQWAMRQRRESSLSRCPGDKEIARVAEYWERVKVLACKHPTITLTAAERPTCGECGEPIRMLSDAQIENMTSRAAKETD